MYKFKMLLFNRILQYRNSNRERVCMQAGIPSRTIQKWANDYTIIPVWGIVAICNTIRISIASLLDNQDNESEDDIYINLKPIPEDKFVPLTYNKKAIENIYRKGGWASITKKEFITKIGVYDGTVNNWLRNEKALRLSTLIEICNVFELNINNFIIDPNQRAVSPTKEASNHALSSVFNQMQTEIKRLQSDTLVKSKLIASMQKEMDELKEMHLFEKQQLIERQPSIVAEGYVPYGLPKTNNSISPLNKNSKLRYVFNKYLLKSLPALSGLSIDIISSLCKLSPIYIEEGSDEFRFSRLIALCNKLHISIRHFFLQEGELYIVGRPENYFSDAVRFRRITFCPENIVSLAGADGGVLGLSRSYFCEAVGVTPSAFSQWIKDEKQSSLSVNGLLRICNAYHISPDFFFDDPNTEIPRSYPVSVEDMLFTENLMLKKHVKEQKKIIEELQKKNLIIK